MRGLLRLGTVGLHFCLANGDRLGQKALDQADKLAPLRNWKLRQRSIRLEQVSLLVVSWAHDRLPLLAGPIPRRSRLEAYRAVRATRRADRPITEGTW